MKWCLITLVQITLAVDCPASAVGICTPFIVHWPAGIRDRNALRHQPGHVIDLVPTLMDLAGVKAPDAVDGLKVPPMHGRSLLPVLRDENAAPPHESLWFHHDGHSALRAGDWKLVVKHHCPPELYQMVDDRCETANLAARHPEKVAGLQAAFDRLAAEFAAVPARMAFKLKLKPGMAAEYKKRHAEIWPELPRPSATRASVISPSITTKRSTGFSSPRNSRPAIRWPGSARRN